MRFKKNNPGCNCCAGEGCFEFTDDFNRANSTTLGTDWNEVAGDWEILNNELHEKVGGGGTSGARVHCTQPVPIASAGEMHVVVYVHDAAEGDVFKVYPCCDDTTTIGDTTVTFTCGAAAEWTVEISGDAAATVTQTAGGEPVGLYVCADHAAAMVLATLANASETDGPAWADYEDPGDGRYAAIGHNNVSTGGTFDDFTMGELRTGDLSCQNCWCRCETHAVHRSLVATIFDAVNRASCLDTLDIDMEWEWNDGTPRWHGEGTGDLAGVTLDLYCDDLGTDFLLFASPSSCFLLAHYHPDASSTCDNPFSLIYGPFSLAYTMACGLCYGAYEPTGCMDPSPPSTCYGEFWIAITEAGT